jgi:predicted DNA-binding protein with PD1-like motif
MRRIEQPGPPAEPRSIAVPATTIPIDALVEPGALLLDRLIALLETHRCDSGTFRISSGAFGPFAYVMPALSPDADHAAYYSETFRPAGLSRLESGAVTVGLRDGDPFFHCHALWTEEDDNRHGGHALPADTIIAEPVRIQGIGLHGARFETKPDPETGFTLFTPVPTGSATGGVNGADALAVRLKPNQDITRALEAVTREAGWDGAVVHGGVGSIIGARYTDAPAVEPFATEMFLTRGLIDANGRESRLDAALVDYTGAVSAGTLVVDDNPILMTLEVVLTARGPYGTGN